MQKHAVIWISVFLKLLVTSVCIKDPELFNTDIQLEFLCFFYWNHFFPHLIIWMWFSKLTKTYIRIINKIITLNLWNIFRIYRVRLKSRWRVHLCNIGKIKQVNNEAIWNYSFLFFRIQLRSCCHRQPFCC